MPEGEDEAAGLRERLVAAMRLDLEVYRIVSVSRQARTQAIGVVLLAGLANGIGLIRKFGPVAVGIGFFQSFVSWWLWSLVVAVVAFLFGGRRAGRSVLRATAFANAPGIFLVFGLVPTVGGVLRAVVALWMVSATVPAVRAVYDLRRWRAIAVVLVTFAIYWGVGQASDYFAGS